MAAEHSLLLETLREIIKLLSDKSLASLIKSKNLESSVDDFSNLVKAYEASQGELASSEGSDGNLEQVLQDINQHLATFSQNNLIELKKLDFVENIKPRT